MSVASVEEEFLIYIRNEFGWTFNSNFKNTFSGKTSNLEPYLKHIVERGYRKSLSSKPKDPYDIVAWASCSTIDKAVKHISYIISKVITDFENILKNKQEEKTPIIYQQYIDYIIDMLNKEMSLSTKNICSLLIQLAHSSELFTFILFGINKPNEDMLDRNNKIKYMEWPCGMFLNLALSISKVLVIQDTLKEKVSSVPVENDDRREFMKNIYSKSVLFCVPLMMALGLQPTTNKNNISENDSRVIHNGVYSSFIDFCDQYLDMIREDPWNKPTTSSNRRHKYNNTTNTNNNRSIPVSSSSKYVRNDKKRKFNNRRYENNHVESDYDDNDDVDDHHGNVNDCNNMENDDDDDDDDENN